MLHLLKSKELLIGILVGLLYFASNVALNRDNAQFQIHVEPATLTTINSEKSVAVNSPVENPDSFKNRLERHLYKNCLNNDQSTNKIVTISTKSNLSFIWTYKFEPVEKFISDDELEMLGEAIKCAGDLVVRSHNETLDEVMKLTKNNTRISQGSPAQTQITQFSQQRSKVPLMKTITHSTIVGLIVFLVLLSTRKIAS